MPTDTSPTLLLLLAAMLNRHAGASPMLAEDPSLGMASGGIPPALVAPAPPGLPRRDGSYSASDLRITTAIRDALGHLALGSDPAAIRIVTRNGAVSLSGVVRDGAGRRRIQDMVMTIPGAWKLTDSLTVRE